MTCDCNISNVMPSQSDLNSGDTIGVLEVGMWVCLMKPPSVIFSFIKVLTSNVFTTFIGISQYTNVTLVWDTYTSALESSNGTLLVSISIFYGAIVVVLFGFKALFWKLEGAESNSGYYGKKDDKVKHDDDTAIKRGRSLSPSRSRSQSPRTVRSPRDILRDHHTIATSIKQYLMKNYFERIFVGVFSDLPFGKQLSRIRIHINIKPHD